MPASPDHVTALAGVLVALLGGGGGLWAFLGSRASGKVDLIKVAQSAAKEMIDDLRTEVDRQGKRISELEAKEKADKELRHQLAQQVMAEQALKKIAEARADAAEARCEALTGEIRQLTQRIDSLQRQLVAAGLPLDHPAFRDGALVELAATGPPAT